MLIARVLLLLFLSVALISCAPRRVDMSAPAFYNEKTSSIVMIRKIDYDSHGLPMFQSVLQRRPEKAGEQFTFVYYWDNKPVKSFDIAIVGRKPDMLRPLAVIYDWTGKGFVTGVRLAVDSLRGVANNKDGWMVPVASLVVGTAAGFVIGVGASVPVTITEINTLIIDSEVLIGYSEYAYDQEGRLHLVRTFQPAEEPRELVRTEYIYRDNETIPSQTIIYSYPEDKTRTIP